MAGAARWRAIIERLVAAEWPGLDPRWIEAQVHVESRGDPHAVSPVGAAGLLQLMPGTAREVGCLDPRDPGDNLRGGIRYLHTQWTRLAEIADQADRMRWAWASYNGGRGYVNRALSLSRLRYGPASRWAAWDVSSGALSWPECTVRGKRPDWRQMVDYVARIEAAGERLGAQLEVPA